MRFFKHCWSVLATYAGPDDEGIVLRSDWWLLRGEDGVFRHPPQGSRAERIRCPDCRGLVPFSKHHLFPRFDTNYERDQAAAQLRRLDVLHAQLLATQRWMRREV